MLNLTLPVKLRTWPTKPKVLPYFVGQARTVYDKIVSADARFNRMVEPQIKRLSQRRCKKPTFRQPEVLDMYRQRVQAGTDYGQSSAFTTLSFDRCLVETTAVRLAQMKGRHQDWNTEESEKGVVLLEVSLKATPEDILLTMHPLVTFNLHAMARYFERAFGRADEDGLLAAIWNTLSDVPDILVREEEDFHLPIPEAGGSWHGILVNSNSSAPRSRAASRWTCGPSTANRMRGIL